METGLVDRPYYGWIVVGMAMGAFTLVLGLSFSSFGVFVVPVARDLGLARADVNLALILLSLGGAVAAPTIGHLCDRLPLKPLMMLSALAFGGALAVLGLSRSLWLDMVVLLLVLPFAVQGAGNITMPVLITRWFRARRGRAMALGTLGMATGGALIPPIMGLLIERYGWRGALVIGGCAGAMILLALFAFVRDRPEAGELEGEPSAGDGEAAAAPVLRRALTVAEVLGSAQFWLMATSTAIVMGVTVGIQATLVPFALDTGLNTVVAASLMSGAGLGALIGQLLLAVFADRVHREKLLTVIYLTMALLSAIPLISSSFPSLVVMAFGFGVSGSVIAVYYALLADRFGPASFGTAQGLSMPLIALVSAAAARLSGEVFDRTGHYDALFYGFIIALLLAAAMIYATRYVKAPHQLAIQ